jgi:hypothetical protein
MHRGVGARELKKIIANGKQLFLTVQREVRVFTSWRTESQKVSHGILAMVSYSSVFRALTTQQQLF